jgi:hypothetical protein
MTLIRWSGLVAAAGAATLLSGCVVAPIGARPYAVYPAAQPVYVEPSAVVVVPAPGYYGGYGHRHRNWR